MFLYVRLIIGLFLSVSIASAGVTVVPSQFAPGGGIGGTRIGNLVLYGSSNNEGRLYVATDDDKIKRTIQLAEVNSMVIAQKLKVLVIRKKACEEFARKLNDSTLKVVMEDIVWSIMAGGVGMFLGAMGSFALASEVTALKGHEVRLMAAGAVVTMVLAAAVTYYAVHSHRFNAIYASQWENFKSMGNEQRISEYKSIIESIGSLSKDVDSLQAQASD